MKNWQDRFRMISSVYLVLKNDKDEVLLLRRQNTGYKDGELGLPAGHVDGGESLLKAMCREAKEEVGIDLIPSDLTLVHTMHRNRGDHERIDFFFQVDNWTGKVINAEPDKCSELCWFDINNLPADVIDYYAQMFNCIRNQQAYSEFGWGEK